jgi:hypothetical protein
VNYSSDNYYYYSSKITILFIAQKSGTIKYINKKKYIKIKIKNEKTRQSTRTAPY